MEIMALDTHQWLSVITFPYKCMQGLFIEGYIFSLKKYYEKVK